MLAQEHDMINPELLYDRVLLVEDSKREQQSTLNALKTFGCTCDIASNGLEALHMVTSRRNNKPYELILMDCDMPGLNGYDTACKIRSAVCGIENSEVPIVALLPTSSLQSDRERCMAVGMSDCLTKPPAAKALEAAIRRWINLEAVMQAAAREKKLPLQEKINDLLLWDKALFLNRLRNDAAARKIVTLFFTEMEKAILDLSHAVTNNDHGKVMIIANAMRGICGHLCLPALSAWVDVLLKCLRGQEGLSTSEVCSQIQSCFSRTKQHMKQHAPSLANPQFDR